MVVSRIAGILALVLSVPIIVAYLGPEGYGIWESMLAIAGMAMVFQMVFSGTILWRISISFGAQDPVETRRLVRIGVFATLMLTVVFVPLVHGFRDQILVGLQIPEQWVEDAKWILPSLVAVVLLGGINQTLLTVVTGYQRAGVAALIQALGLMANSLTAIAVLLLGGGLSALLLGYMAGFLVTLVVIYPIAISLCGPLSLLPTWPTKKEITILGPFAGLLLLSNLTFLFRDHTDKIVLASLASPTVTGYFGMAQRLSSLVLQVCTVSFVPFTAMVGALFAQGDWHSIQNLYSRLSAWMGALAGLAGFLVCVLHEPLFVLWLGKPQPEAYAFLALLLLGATSAIIFAGAGVALAKGIGRPGLETAYTLVTLSLIVVSKPVLIAAFGPMGSIASSTGSWSLGAIFFLLLLHRKVELPKKVIPQTLSIFFFTLFTSILGWWASAQFSWVGWERLQTAIALLVAIPILSAIYLGTLATLGLIDFAPLKEAFTKKFLAWPGKEQYL